MQSTVPISALPSSPNQTRQSSSNIINRLDEIQHFPPLNIAAGRPQPSPPFNHRRPLGSSVASPSHETAGSEAWMNVSWCASPRRLKPRGWYEGGPRTKEGNRLLPKKRQLVTSSVPHRRVRYSSDFLFPRDSVCSAADSKRLRDFVPVRLRESNFVRLSSPSGVLADADGNRRCLSLSIALRCRLRDKGRGQEGSGAEGVAGHQEATSWLDAGGSRTGLGTSLDSHGVRVS